MKLNFYQNAVKWSAVSLSCLTMVMSPVAMGKEAEKLSKANVASAVRDLGLQKKQTVGQYWDKFKADVPGYMYKDIDAFVKQNRNMLMPDVAVDSLKSTTGEDIPVIRLTQNGKTDTIQFFGEKDKFIKYNGVVLTEKDMQRLKDAEAKIENSDFYLKSNADKERALKSSSNFNQTYRKDFARFRAFPRMTPQLWKSMTKEQRAGYITQMRLMWLNARKVVSVTQAKKSTKKTKKSASNESFIQQLLIGQEAFAASTDASDVIDVDGAPVRGVRARATPRSGDASRARVASGGATLALGEKCVVAGYIGEYAPGTNVRGNRTSLCNVDNALAGERYNASGSLAFVKEANDVCKTQGANMVACNPVVYGYLRDGSGNPKCVDRRSEDFQVATTFPGPCDRDSRLNTETFAVTYGADQREAQKQTVESQQKQGDEPYKLTKDYIDSILAKPKGSRTQATTLSAVLNGQWSQDLDTELVGIQQQFEEEINQAIQICESSVLPPQPDRNQKDACDQLHRRWLFTEKFVAEFRQKGCLDSSHYIGSYDGANVIGHANTSSGINKRVYAGENVCQCPAPGGGSSAPPSGDVSGSGAPPQVSSGTGGKLVKIGESCNGEIPPQPPVSGDPTPACNLTGDHVDVATCSCTDGYEKKGNKCEKDKGGFPLWAKIGLGLVAVAGVLCLTHTLICKKKKDKPDTPVVPPETCPLGKTGTPPSCVCSNVCTVGTLNPESCTCDVVPEPPVCALPKTIVNGSCGCNLTCVSGQHRDPSANECRCIPDDVPLCPGTSIPVSQGCPTTPKCPDGSNEPSSGPTGCPKCSDGVTYVPAAGVSGCPVVTPPSEGGNGNNCTSGNCSGGVPTNN